MDEPTVQQLPNLLKEWMQTESELKALSAEIREKRKKLAVVRTMITKIMKQGQIGEYLDGGCGESCETDKGIVHEEVPEGCADIVFQGRFQKGRGVCNFSGTAEASEEDGVTCSRA